MTQRVVRYKRLNHMTNEMVWVIYDSVYSPEQERLAVARCQHYYPNVPVDVLTTQED